MAKGGGTTKQISEVKLPEWVEKASQNNYKFAQQIADKPFNPYLGKTVADVATGTEDAYDLFYNTIGQGNQNYANASSLFDKQGGGILGLDRSQYMNPLIDEVEGKALGALDKSRVQALMGNADKARSAKAFGGDRAAIVDAVTNAETAEKAGLLSAGLRKDAWDTATSTLMGDLAGFGAAGQGQLATGDAFNKQRMSDVTGLLGIGQQQQAQQQMELDDTKGKFDEANNYDLERLNTLLASLGMSPYGRTESTTAKTSGGGFDPAQFGLGVLSIFAGMSPSDERVKENLVRVGEEEGIPVYEYNYIGNDTKMRGPMAQDIEKVLPGAVVEVGGVKMVDRQVLGILGWKEAA
jgi:hypothetical protein